MKIRSYFAFGVLASSLVAGGHAKSDTVIELASIAGSAQFTLNVETVCNGQDPVFRLVNTGADWPRLARVEIYKSGQSAPIFDRNMRMKSGQKATFRMPTKRLGQGEFSLAVLPSWYQRDVDADVTLSCN